MKLSVKPLFCNPVLMEITIYLTNCSINVFTIYNTALISITRIKNRLSSSFIAERRKLPIVDIKDSQICCVGLITKATPTPRTFWARWRVDRNFVWEISKIIAWSSLKKVKNGREVLLSKAFFWIFFHSAYEYLDAIPTFKPPKWKHLFAGASGGGGGKKIIAFSHFLGYFCLGCSP